MTLRLRPARLDDALLLLEWRNDPLTRAMSTSDLPVMFSGHIRWLRGRLADPDCRFYVAEFDGEPAGTIRLEGTPHATISWIISPAFRGRGICQQMAAKALAHEQEVTAYVRPDNEICGHILTKLGFTLEEDGELQRWEWHRPSTYEGLKPDAIALLR